MKERPPLIGKIMLTAAAAAFAALVAGGAAAGQADVLAGIDRTVRDCRAADTVSVPMITWGADLVTVHAAASGGAFEAVDIKADLFREDVFARQVEAYLRCETPFLRGTIGMIAQVSDIVSADSRTAPQAIYQHSWSNGGDALVAGPGIEKPADLAGKRVALQALGPHVDYLFTVLAGAGVAPDAVDIVWTGDLVGFGPDTPAGMLMAGKADAAMTIIPDALALTSGGTIGTGSEDSVKDARILLSTKSASRVVADVYVVRPDFLALAPDLVENFVAALIQAEEETSGVMRGSGPAKDALLRAGAGALLDAPDATADVEALWADAETAGAAGNLKFFADEAYARNYVRLSREAQGALLAAGLISSTSMPVVAPLDWAALTEGYDLGPDGPRFDGAAVASAVTRMQAQGAIDDGTLFTFEVNFKPNQTEFPAELYAAQFRKVVDLASTYGGAVISIEGHADPLEYLRAKAAGQKPLMLRRMVQSARNLSVNRAASVRDGVMEIAAADGMAMDPSQFAVSGIGYAEPRSGLCGDDPCAPKTEAEWLANMRVVFRVVNVEAEASVFVPLN